MSFRLPTPNGKAKQFDVEGECEIDVAARSLATQPIQWCPNCDRRTAMSSFAIKAANKPNSYEIFICQDCAALIPELAIHLLASVT